MRTSIVIPTLNRSQSLQKTVESHLKAAPFDHDIEIIIIDQSESSPPLSFPFPARIPIIHKSVPFRGTTRARNEGIRIATGDIIIFTDDDVTVWDGFIDAHLAPYSDGSIWGVSGCVLPEGGIKTPACSLTPRQVSMLNTTHGLRHDVDFFYDVPWAYGCNMSFRKSILLQLRGFDEGFHGVGLGEENEFCHRLIAGGGRIRYSPDACVTHHMAPAGGSRDTIHQVDLITEITDNAIYFLQRTHSNAINTAGYLFALYRHHVLGSPCRRTPSWLLSATAGFFKGAFAGFRRSLAPAPHSIPSAPV